MRPHMPDKTRARGHRREHRHLRHDRLAGEERPEQQRQGRACGASRIRASTPSAGMIDAHPGAEGRLAAGADRRLVHRRRLAPQRRVLPAARLQLLRGFGQPAARADDQLRLAGSTTARRTATSSSSTAGAAGERRTRSYFKGEIAFWNELMAHGTYDDFWQARNLRPHLKNIKPAVHDRRRLVRRRGPVRRARDLQERRAPEPAARSNIARHGPLGPRRLGARRRRLARRRPLRREDRPSSTARRSSCRSSTFHLKGKGDPKLPEACVFETGPQPVARASTPGRRRRPPRRTLYLRAGRHAARCAAAGRRPSAVRRVRQRSGQAGAVHRPDRDRHDARVHGRRPALRRRAGRTCSSTRPTSLDDGRDGRRADRGRACTSRPRGTDSDWVVKLIDVYPDDYPDPTQPRPRLPAGRRAWAATSSSCAAR